MKKLFLGFIAIGSLSAQASMLELNGPLNEKLFEAHFNQEKSYFETLGDLFNSGTLPDLTKISDIAWAGRCFSKKQPNEPINAGYIFRPVRKDVGPIESGPKAYEGFSYWSLSEAPNYFDRMNVEQVFSALPSLKAKIVTLKADSIEIDLDEAQKSNLKLSGKYLVEEISGPAENASPSDGTLVGLRCYYFIPDLKN